MEKLEEIADEDETLMRRAEERERKKDIALRRQSEGQSALKRTCSGEE